jgi:hypothetical protein
MVIERFEEALKARKRLIAELELPYVEREPVPLET